MENLNITTYIPVEFRGVKITDKEELDEVIKQLERVQICIELSKDSIDEMSNPDNITLRRLEIVRNCLNNTINYITELYEEFETNGYVLLTKFDGAYHKVENASTDYVDWYNVINNNQYDKC